MGILEDLKRAGFKPQANTDGDFQPLKGQYECECVTLRREASQFRPGTELYHAEWKVTKTVDGDAGEGRSFHKRYGTDDEAAIKELLQDFFTMGVDLSIDSEEELQASFEQAIGKTTFIRAWAWTPIKDRDGNELPEAERRAFQSMVVRQKPRVKSKSSKTVVPF